MAHQPLGVGGEHAAEASKLLDQHLGQRLHVHAFDGVEQQKLEKLVIGKRFRVRREEAFAQAAPVVLVVGLGRFGAEQVFASTLFSPALCRHHTA